MAAAATDILSLADAKLQLRIDGDDHDSLVTTAIGAAVSHVSAVTRLPLVDHSKTIYRAPPASSDAVMTIEDAYLKTITEWTYITPDQNMQADRAGTITIADLGRIETDMHGYTHIQPPVAGWPDMSNRYGVRPTTQKIVYTRGYTPAAHEDRIKQAVILVMRDFYEQPDRDYTNKSTEAVLAQLMDFR